MDQKEFEAIMARAPKPVAQTAPAAPDTTSAPATGSLMDSPEFQAGAHQIIESLQGTPEQQAQKSLTPTGTPQVVEAAMTGAAKGIFETKDFLFGETPEQDRSAFRTSIEDRDKQLADNSMLNGFSSGVGQFAISMLGLGKASEVAKALPWFGKGLAAATEAAPKATSAVKAAIAGATAFDPHQERLSNLIQDTPLANPLTAWLEAKPDDTAAEGRVKAAMESIGLDGVIAGTFMGATRIWKALRNGDAAEAARLADAMQAEQKAAIANEQPGASASGPDSPVVPNAGDGGAPANPTLEAPATATSAQAVPHDPWSEFAQHQPRDVADATPPTGPVFHGTSHGNFDKFDPYSGEYGLMGSGTYFTENPNIAAEYTSKGRGGHPAVLAANIKAANPLNMDAPADVAAWTKSFGDYLDNTVDYAGKTNEQMYREVELGVSQGMIPRYEGAEIMQDGLRDMGHDSVTHIGGGRHPSSKGTKHRVWIVFDDDQATITGKHLPAKEPQGGQVNAPQAAAKATAPTPASQEAGAGGQTVGEAPTIVANATDAADAAGTALNSPAARIRLSDENTHDLLKGMDDDAEALTKNGGWYQAIEAGHTFGRGEGIPYVKLNADSDLDDFMARVVDVAHERLDNMKGGAVLTDAKLSKVADQMSTLFNADPAQVLGLIHQAGKAAPAMVANMEAGYLVANRMFQDTYALASRIRMGDFTGFGGGRDAAINELKKRASMAASVYGSARAMTAAGGRAVRRMRTEFKIDPEAVAKLKSMDPEGLVDLLASTEGNPRALAKATNPGLLSKVTDWGQYILINNLVSGPKTQLINAMTNAYMLGARPLERIFGAGIATAAGKGNASTNRVFKEALKQYAYMGTAFHDGFSMARKAFMVNDSVMAPHHTEAYRANAGQAVQEAAGIGMRFRPWDSPGSLLHNALMVAGVGGLPTRALGFIDEAMKQTTYRSKVMAAAHVDGAEQGIQAGLTGQALDDFVKTFVRDKVDAAFDQLGRATDPQALREAQIATFQQDLLPGTFGKWMSQGVTAHPLMRLVLPFVKTPTNVLRYGWKMTPGLNLLQSEYREMLLGHMGMEAKLQASGQMMMGGLFMGTAAYLVSMGMTTGSPPRDPKMRQALQATGWQPYSVIVQHPDGTKTYIPYSRFDPVAMPLGIVTDLMDALHANDGQTTPDWEATAASLLFAVSNQFTNKTYLTGVSQALDALMQSDATGPQKVEKWIATTAANFIPGSAFLRQVNPDPYMRDARDLTDKLMATVPGYSENVRAKYDAWGDPVRRVGLWSSDNAQIVDTEMQRLILESGSAVSTPNPVNNGVDLRNITMSDGSNAFEKYQQLSGHPGNGHNLKDVIAKFIQSDGYKLAPDGGIGQRGTKLWRLHTPVDMFRRRALMMLKRDPVVRDAFRAADLKVRAQLQANKAAAGGNETPAKKLGDAFGQDLSALGIPGVAPKQQGVIQP